MGKKSILWELFSLFMGTKTLTLNFVVTKFFIIFPEETLRLIHTSKFGAYIEVGNFVKKSMS